MADLDAGKGGTVKRYLWLLLTICVTVFAGLISGSWLGIQTADTLGSNWGWWGWTIGVFGATLAVIALFGGVSLGTNGDRVGWVVAAVSGCVTATMDISFFWPKHGLLAVPLGLFPTLLAVLSGVVESRSALLGEKKPKPVAAVPAPKEHERNPSPEPEPTVSPVALPDENEEPTIREKVTSILDENEGDVSDEEISRRTGAKPGTVRKYRSE